MKALGWIVGSLVAVYLCLLLLAGAIWVVRATAPFVRDQICSVPHSEDSGCGWTR